MVALGRWRGRHRNAVDPLSSKLYQRSAISDQRGGSPRIRNRDTPDRMTKVHRLPSSKKTSILFRSFACLLTYHHRYLRHLILTSRLASSVSRRSRTLPETRQNDPRRFGRRSRDVKLLRSSLQPPAYRNPPSLSDMAQRVRGQAILRRSGTRITFRTHGLKARPDTLPGYFKGDAARRELHDCRSHTTFSSMMGKTTGDASHWLVKSIRLSKH